MQRLEQVLSGLGQAPAGKTCQAMQGLIKESQEAIKEHQDPEVSDAVLIAAAQRVEHYEIAGYGTVVTYACLRCKNQPEQESRNAIFLVSPSSFP